MLGKNLFKQKMGLTSMKSVIETGCESCPQNLCKSQIVKSWLDGIEKGEGCGSADESHVQIFYFGDGKNDVCPALILKENDVAFARKDHPMADLLGKKEKIDCQVVEWRDMEELREILENGFGNCGVFAGN